MSESIQYCFENNPYISEKLNNYFDTLKKSLSQKFGDNVSVLLVGSLSRGEGTWIKKEEQYFLISDIEYFVILSDKIKDIADVEIEIKRVNNQVFAGEQVSAFHIDYTFMHKSNLPALERKLIIFEAKRFGKTIVGEDCRKYLPDVNINNINFHDMKDIISHRLFSMVYYGFKCIGDEQEYIYLLAKNSLDLMTVYLTNRKILEGGFINRYRKLVECCDDHELVEYFGQCLRVKMGQQDAIVYSREQMRAMFLELCNMLFDSTKIPFHNYVKNIKLRVRRYLGIMKRAIRCKTITSFDSQYRRMIYFYNSEIQPDEKFLRNHYTLYGYPNLLSKEEKL